MGRRDSRSVLGTLAVVLATAVLTACGDAPDGIDAACRDGATSAGAPGDAEIVLAFGAGVDRLTPGVGAGVLLVYADGAVATTLPAEDLATAHVSMIAPGFHGEQPGDYVAGTLSGCALAAALERADDLFAEPPSFGMPVTDATGTTISYRVDGQPVVAGIDMFDPDDPDEWRGSISPQEQRNRDAAAELWHLLVGAVRLTGDLPVDRLELDSPFGTIGADELDWSLPSLPELLSEGGCAEITGADVATVLDALAAGGGELLDSEPWRLSARTLPPGMPACGGR